MSSPFSAAISGPSVPVVPTTGGAPVATGGSPFSAAVGRAAPAAAAATSSSRSTPAIIEDLRKAAAAHKGGGITGFLGNLAGDVSSVVRGIPSAAEEFVVKPVVASGEGIYGGVLDPAVHAVAGHHLPGGQAAIRASANIQREGGKAIAATAHDYATRYGPTVSSLVHGHPLAAAENLGRQIYQHPGLVALDAASLWGGAGALARAVGRTGVALGADEGGVLGRAADVRRVPTEGDPAIPPRYREPLRARMRPSADYPEGTTVEIPRGPRSKNPLSRPFQRVGERAADWLRSRTAESTAPVARRLSEQARAERHLTRTVREDRVVSESDAMKAANALGLKDLNRALSRLRTSRTMERLGIGNRGEGLAVWLHQHDLFNQPGMTALEARAQIAKTMRQGIDEVAARGGRVTEARKNLAAILSLPDELVDPARLPDRVRAAVEHSRRVAEGVEPTARALLGLRPETQAARRTLASRVLVGESRHDPGIVRQTPELVAARDAVRGAREDLRQAAASGNERRLRGASSRLADARRHYARMRQQARGGLTEPVRPTGGEAGIYTPWRSAEARGGRGGTGAQGGGGFGPASTAQATGESIRTGDITMDPALVGEHALGTVRLREAHHTLFGDGTAQEPGVLQAMLYHDAGGQAISGSRAAQLALADPDRATLINVGRLRKAFERSQESLDVEGGLGADAGGEALHEVMPTRDQVRQLAQGKIPEGARQGDYVLANTRAVEEWRGALGRARTRPTELFDRMLGSWKAGTLILRPAFYVHNLLGDLVQYSLLSGSDFAAIREAARPEVRALIPARAEETMAAEVAGARIRGPRGTAEGAGRLTMPFRRAIRNGFLLNDKIESTFRRGGYLAAAKQLAREQGIAGSPEHVLDEVARHPELARQVLQRFHRFLGDYRNFGPTERMVLRRVFPFYSWLRTITRLAFTLPARTPLRAQALALASQAANETQNPLDFLLPASKQGAIQLPGGLALGTHSSNPFGTIQDIVGSFGDAAAGEGLTSALTDAAAGVAGQSLNPLLTMAVGRLTGIDPYSQQPYTAPPGFGGTAAGFGQNPQAIDPISGQPIYVQGPRPPVLQQAASELFPLESQVRQLLGGGRLPYDTTTDLQLLLSRLGAGPPAWQAFQKPSTTPSGFQYLPQVGALGSYLGMPVYGTDPQQIVQRAQSQLDRFNQAQQSTLSEQARLQAQVGG